MAWNSDGNVNLSKHLFDLPWYISFIGRKDPIAVTTKVTVMCHFSSKPLMGNFFYPVDEKVYFLEETYERRVWTSLGTNSDGMILEIFLWEVDFSSSRNWLEGSIFLDIPFRLVQFMDFKTLRAQFSAGSRPLPNWFNIPENVKTKILMLHSRS